MINDELSTMDKEILAIANRWTDMPGFRWTWIRTRTGKVNVRYYQELNALIDTAAALAYAPVLVARLRRLRDATRRRTW